MFQKLSQLFFSRQTPAERQVWFYRDYTGFTGGNLKHTHYFQNVQALAGFSTKLVFGHEPLTKKERQERELAWPQQNVTKINWAPCEGDLLFLAGLDWNYLFSTGLGINLPKINLIQHVRHADSQTELYGFLTERAIRICVSQEVADAITLTGKANGPVIVIPNGIDVPQLSKTALKQRYRNGPSRQKVLIVGYKMPVLSKGLSDALSQCGVEHRLVSELMDRVLFLAALKEYDVVVCCPNVTEGFYLPALEVMAAGAILIVPDCVGNRGFCIDGTTCLMPAYTADKMRESVLKALSLTEPQRNALLYAALKKVGEYSLEKERKAFYAVLKNVDQLW